MSMLFLFNLLWNACYIDIDTLSFNFLFYFENLLFFIITESVLFLLCFSSFWIIIEFMYFLYFLFLIVSPI